MGILRKYACFLFLGLVISCVRDDAPNTQEIPESSETPKTPETSGPRTVLTAKELTFLEEYEYVTFNLSPTSFGADVNEKWGGNIRLFLDGEITENYRLEVSKTLAKLNAILEENGPKISLIEAIETSNIHLIFGPLASIESIWPDMFAAIGTTNFKGYALYDRDQNFNITRGRIWVRTNSIPLFSHELGHILGLGHARPQLCFGDINYNESFMCSFLKVNLSVFDTAILQTLYSPEIEVGKNFSELKPVIENLLFSGKILVD